MEQIAKMRAELSAADEAVCDRWLETRMDSRREISDPNGEALKRMVEKHLTEEGLVGDTCRFIRKNLWDLVFLKSEWVIGGDGWAGDSGVGSLLHILSMDEKTRAIREAAAYNGPALIVAEVPCANAGEITAL